MNLSLKLGEGVNLDLRLGEIAASLTTPEALALAVHLEDAADDSFTLFTCGPLVLPPSGGVIRLSLEVPEEVDQALTLSAGEALQTARVITSAARTLHGIRAGRRSDRARVDTTLGGRTRHLPFTVGRAGTC
ncbi:hypothetical protein DAETH_47670 (plasmid) [Deinococcus aetherius]|uniref:Uncharacterized protein n=1 Tax=Deinococcus aetherius TaxID=200252 RepID=A0ABN6RS47_9DEIO|nr:hypothetical protein [Deinococcus aetherius]BDP44798.1 hypothetical protein DAETH_47670 [Deinococcus aetherius]